MTSVAENEVVLIDLSSIAYPIWHTSQSDPDPNKTSQQVVARVRAIASGKPHVAICCDAGRSFRYEIASSYKANRPERDGTLQHQIALACEQLTADGFPVWAVPGFEADDLVASATARGLATKDRTVLIVSADKDLLQLLGTRVTAMSVRDGSIITADGVGEKFGVRPEQMRDYLTLVGDTSDNVAGAKGIGPKKAAELLARFGSLDALYQQLDARGGAALGLQPAMTQSLREFKASGTFETTRRLITLRTDVDVPFAAVDEPRVPKDVPALTDITATDDVEADSDPEDTHDEPLPPMRAAAPPVVEASHTTESTTAASTTTSALVRQDPPAPVEWQLELGPRSLREARTLAQDMFASRLFSAYGTPQGVLSTIMLGRELGMPALAALRGIHIIEGRHSLSAQTMVALVLKSGLAEYFEPVEFDAEHAIFVTKRRGARKEITLEHTIEMARTAGLIKADSNWAKIPTDMCVARAQSRLCRLVYPDLVGGLYTPEELNELRGAMQVVA